MRHPWERQAPAWQYLLRTVPGITRTPEQAGDTLSLVRSLMKHTAWHCRYSAANLVLSHRRASIQTLPELPYGRSGNYHPPTTGNISLNRAT